MLTEILPPEERAIEKVVERYQRVAPAVTRFARTLCGNQELRVRLGSEAKSSPNEIVVTLIRPVVTNHADAAVIPSSRKIRVDPVYTSSSKWINSNDDLGLAIEYVLEAQDRKGVEP